MSRQKIRTPSCQESTFIRSSLHFAIGSFHFIFHSPNITLYHILFLYYSSFHFIFRYPNITLYHILFLYYSSFHLIFHYPNVTLYHILFLYYSSFHFIFHSPNITLHHILFLYYSSFHFIFHDPYITPIYWSSFHFLFHYPYPKPYKPFLILVDGRPRDPSRILTYRSIATAQGPSPIMKNRDHVRHMSCSLNSWYPP